MPIAAQNLFIALILAERAIKGKDVENKTTLKGAVIASTTNDPANLTLDTGSFEYVNVKDKSTSFNIGASVGFSSSTTEKQTGIPATVELETSKRFNANASYGYTDKRQTNFATIGEGTIIVRDGKSDLSKLNRDVTIAQYGTFDVGTKGVTGVDTKLISDLSNFDERKAEALKAYDNVKSAVITTVEMYQKTTELVFGPKIDQNNTASPKIINGQDEKGNLLRITDYRDGSIKITQFDENGNVKNEYYQVQKLDVTNAVSYGSLEYIKTKVFLGQVNSEDIKMLTDSVNMAPSGPLQKEIQNAISDIIKNKGLNAADIRGTACVATSLWVGLVLSGSDVPEYSKYFSEQVNDGNIRGKDAYVYDQEKIANAYGKELIRESDYKKFENMMDSGEINYGIVRVGTDQKKWDRGHNMNLYLDNDNMNVSDVGNWKNHGKPAVAPLVTEDNYRYFELIK